MVICFVLLMLIKELIFGDYIKRIKLINYRNKSKLPIFTISGKSRPTSDMCFINESSVVATIYSSSSKPYFAIYDMLLPS